MSSQQPGGHSLPQSDLPDNVENHETETELSPAGLVCDDILSVLDGVANFPDDAKLAVGIRLENILEMFREEEDRHRKDRRKISALRSDLRRVTEKLAILQQEHFGASSEKTHTGIDEDELDLAVIEDDDDPVEQPRGKRRRKVPDDVEPVTVHHFPEDRTCGSCGSDMPSISNWSSMRIRIIPEHVEFVKDIYHTCACNHGICKENKPVSARAPHHIMKGRGIDLGLVTEAACQKFFEHIPTFRMERRLLNCNVNLSRQAIGRNIIHLARHLVPVQQALLEHVKAGYAAHMDETPVRVQAAGKGKCDLGYLWAVCRDERRWNPEAQPAVVYRYAPTRAGSVAAELLSGTALRYLITDGYGGYNHLFSGGPANDALESVRCWAHPRRKFFETWLTTKSKLADWVVKMIRKLYRVEKAAVGLSPEEREAIRQEHSLPVLDKLHTELVKHKDDAQGSLKKAIDHTLKAYDVLRRYVFDGKLEIDNNPVERCMRGIALTKKNSLYAGSHEAAEVWAIYYSLIESARLNRINPRSYLTWVTSEIERNKGEVDYALLLPWHCPMGRIQG